SGSNWANTRVKVSCEGMPLGSGNLSLNHSFFERPNSSISTNHPHRRVQRTAQSAIVRMSESRWRFRRLIRGSGTEAKCDATVAVEMAAEAPEKAGDTATEQGTCPSNVLMEPSS